MSDRRQSRTQSIDAPLPALARSKGQIDLVFAGTGTGTRLARAYQSGCLRVRWPQDPASRGPCAVMMNTAGGLTGGDALTINAEWQDHASGTLTGQAAEKIYRARDGHAAIKTTIRLAPHSSAEWMPQETILFNRASLRRDMQVEMSATSRFLGVEATVFGRAAMGETMEEGHYREGWRIRRDGRLIYADALELDGPISALLQRKAIGAGARASATLILVSGDAESHLETVRERSAEACGAIAASHWNGLLAVRFAAPDGHELRRDMTSILSTLRAGRPLPRVWSC
ncbi:MAG: urease accessory protein UreD [Parvibaculaceae bacterium]|nr:urease accessory protein UreD [Parvibaculaceae bacterium]